VSPEFTWTADPADTPAPAGGFMESLGINKDRVVQLDADNGTAQVLNGAGKVTASGPVTIDDPILTRVWTAYDGLLIGAMTSDASNGKGQLAAYRLDNLKQAWAPVGLSAGDEIKYVHPCGQHVVCVAYNRQSTDTQVVMGVDTQSGKRLDWTKMPTEQFGDFSTDPFWLVLASSTVFGESSFPPQIGCEY